MQPLSMWSLLAQSHFLALTFFYLSHFFYCFSFFFFLFGEAELAPSLVQNDSVAGCSPISPTLGLLCLTTPKAKCVMSVSPSVFRQLEVPSVQLVQFSCPRASHAPCPEMVSYKEYPKVHTN